MSIMFIVHWFDVL